MSTPAKVTPTNVPRKFRVVMVVSLAFNLLFVGLVVGMIIKGPPQGHGRDGADRIRDFYFQALSRDDRFELRKQMRAQGLDLGAGRAQIRGNLASIVATLREDPFDATAFEHAVKGQDQTMAKMRSKGQQVFVDYVRGLDAAARAEIADRLDDIASRTPRR